MALHFLVLNYQALNLYILDNKNSIRKLSLLSEPLILRIFSIIQLLLKTISFEFCGVLLKSACDTIS